MRSVGKRRDAGLDSGERIIHGHGMCERGKTVLLPFLDDERDDALLQPSPELQNLFRRIARRQHGREPGLEEFLQTRRSLLVSQ